MTKIVLDAATRARLADVVNCAELCDESGRPLGHFIPAVDPKLYLDIEVPFTEDELAAAERESEAYNTSEVLRRLRDRERGGAA
jgi:hypothetical protein